MEDVKNAVKVEMDRSRWSKDYHYELKRAIQRYGRLNRCELLTLDPEINGSRVVVYVLSNSREAAHGLASQLTNSQNYRSAEATTRKIGLDHSLEG